MSSAPKEPIPAWHDVFLTDSIQEMQVIDLLEAAVYVCDMAGAIRKYNERTVHLWGWRPEIGSKPQKVSDGLKLFHPDGSDMQFAQTADVACLNDGELRRGIEYLIERPDLSRIHVIANIGPFKSKDGQQVGVIHSFYDITEQKKLQKELHNRNKELHDYVENATIALHWVDAKGIIKWANKAELDMLGYTASEYIGHHISEFHIHANKITDILSRLNGKEILHQYESELRCKDGTVKTGRISSSVYWEDDQFIHTRCFTIDVTELKKTEYALRESEERFKTAANAAPVLIWMADVNKERYFFNKGWLEYTGRTLEQETGFGWSESVHADDVEKLLSTYHSSFDTRQEYKIEYRLRRNDGEYRWVLSHGIPLYSPDQVLQGYIGTCIDIQEKKMMTDALEGLVLKRTMELEEANRLLVHYNKQLEQFAFIASHDMKEPLRKILFFNTHILDSAAGKLNDKEREYLNRSTSAATRMGNLIDNLLEYSRVSARTPQYETVDLNEVADEVLFAYKDTIEETKAVITCSSLPIVQGIAFQLRQLLDNLIGNALKYRHPDRKPLVEISSKTARTASVIALDPEKDYYEITIKDNGVGFTSADEEKIFEIFHRLQTTSSPGTGVGLAICKKIVENHNGTIQTTGVLGKGACFEIYLPVAQ